ncbi:hypothetical protein [Virgibacillus doumboii]|uniref:hypothetical protein n=1 Tax=Virgibacillus doumboii TaxID=2697503 RepID=UPI0013E046A5|nr:hypothetical protein [Virgibacillus doumboii]
MLGGRNGVGISAEEQKHRQKSRNIGRRAEISAEQRKHRQKSENIGRTVGTSAEKLKPSQQIFDRRGKNIIINKYLSI